MVVNFSISSTGLSARVNKEKFSQSRDALSRRRSFEGGELRARQVNPDSGKSETHFTSERPGGEGTSPLHSESGYSLDQFWYSLGLRGNPFKNVSTEEELHDFVSQLKERPSLEHNHLVLTYFYPPQLEPLRGSERSITVRQPNEFFQQLLIPTIIAIYGTAGSGKTMLAVAFEAWLRYSSFPYVVSYITLPFYSDPKTGEFERKLIQHIALDVLLQWIEKAYVLGSWDEVFLYPEEKALIGLAQSLGTDTRINRLLERLIREEYPDNYWQAELLWPQVGRHIVRPVSLSGPMKEVLQKVQSHLLRESNSPLRLKDVAEIVQGWGFERLYMLVDDSVLGSGTVSSSPKKGKREQKMKQLAFLLSESGKHQSWLALRLFLSAAYTSIVTQLSSERGLTFPEYRIKWTWNDLATLVDARLRAYGARFDLSDLVDQSMTAEFIMQLQKRADNNPQKLLQLLQQIVEYHVKYYPDELYLHPEAWRHAENA